MLRQHAVLFLSLTFSLSFEVSRSFAAEDQPILDEIRKAHVALKSSKVGLRVEGKLLEQIEPSGIDKSVRSRISSLAFSLGGDAEKFEQSGTDPRFYDRVFVRRRPRAFVVRREKPAASYYIEQIKDLPPSFSSLMDERESLAIYPMTTILGMRLANLLELPGFHARKVSRVPDGDEELVRVDFDYSPKATPPVKSSGWFRVDPAKGWFLRDDLITQEVPGLAGVRSISDQVTYRPIAGGSFVPARVSNEMVEAGGTMRLTLEVTRYETVSFAAEEFTLSHYGLADVETPPSSSHYGLTTWLVGGAAGVFLLAYLLRRLASGRG